MALALLPNRRSQLHFDPKGVQDCQGLLQLACRLALFQFDNEAQTCTGRQCEILLRGSHALAGTPDDFAYLFCCISRTQKCSRMFPYGNINPW